MPDCSLQHLVEKVLYSVYYFIHLCGVLETNTLTECLMSRNNLHSGKELFRHLEAIILCIMKTNLRGNCKLSKTIFSVSVFRVYTLLEKLHCIFWCKVARQWLHSLGGHSQPFLYRWSSAGVCKRCRNVVLHYISLFPPTVARMCFLTQATETRNLLMTYS